MFCNGKFLITSVDKIIITLLDNQNQHFIIALSQNKSTCSTMFLNVFFGDYKQLSCGVSLFLHK